MTTTTPRAPGGPGFLPGRQGGGAAGTAPLPRAPRPGRSPRSDGHSDRRLRAALLAILFVLSLFAGRLVQTQGFDASALAAAALKQRLSQDTLPAHRGDITDVNGQVLATAVDRVNVTVDQTIVGQYTVKEHGKVVASGAAAAAAALATVLGLPVADVQASITGSKRFAYVTKDVSPLTYRQVAALNVPGVYPEAAPRRIYPAGAVGASIVGFISDGGKDIYGIEKAENNVLSGTPGHLVFERSQDNRQIPGGEDAATAPVPGSTVRLTIDRDIQWKAQTLLDAQVAATKAESGYVVVMNPKTGQLLALASSPTFDANHPGKANPSDTGNRALTDRFEPGSTSKVMTASAAIQEGVIKPEDHLTVDGQIHRGGATFHDSHAHGPEKLTFAGVLAKSSNIGTIMAGERVPPGTMYRYLRAFGLGQKTGVGLPESAGTLVPAKDWSNSQRYTVLFGQGLDTTALEVASVYATIANGGVRVPPRLIDSTIDPSGTVHKVPLGNGVRVVSARTAATVSAMLENVVGEEGTGKAAEIPGYRVAGKTGTAQAANGSHGYSGYTASFIGFAPADKPSVVVAVVIQRPQNGHFGGAVAAPVFQQVMTYALGKLAVPPTGTTAPPLALTWS